MEGKANLSELHWGVLGAGSVAQRRVIPTIQSLVDQRVSALMVRDMDRAQALAGQFDVAGVYNTVDALINDPDVNAVYVSSPVNLHHEHVLKVAKAGKHVFCEKPMALSVEECEDMISACDEAGVHLQVCFVLRGWEIYHRIRSMIQNGDFGRLVEIRAHLAKWTTFDENSWRVNPAQSGGGVLMDMGAHYLDLFRFLVGDLAEVSYMGSNDIFSHPIEDTAFVTTRFKSGAHGVMGLSFAIPHNGNVLEIYGTEGSLFLGKELHIVTSEGETTEPVTFPDYFSGLLQNFAACVFGNAEPIAPGLDGLRNIEAISAAYLSGVEKRTVSLQ